VRTVLWQDPAEISLERCFLQSEPAGSGHTFGGTALLVVRGAPCELRYLVRVDEGWRTRHVEVERYGPADNGRIMLDVSADGHWSVDGMHRADLDGCVDVDLEFTPATNALPIRRLRLAVDAGADIDVAWVRVPHLRVEPSRQHYRRLATSRYEFRVGTFSAELTVDHEGLVQRYGEAWRQVAAEDR
jgi:hypothetical protein